MTPLPIHNRFIEIPAGRFSMGSNINDPATIPNETPQHEKFLPAFYISCYPITNGEYKVFSEDSKYTAPAYWADSHILEQQNDHPVVNISFQDANAYCDWLSDKNNHIFRLPTEYEWEKAARGPKDMRRYPWEGEWANFRCNSKESGRLNTTPVTEYEKVQENEYGVADLIGNVWEWTSSWYQTYPYSQHSSPSYGETYRIIRGGSYHNGREAARISERGRYIPEAVRPYVGFRIVSDEKPVMPFPTQPFGLHTIHQDIESFFNEETHKQIDPTQLHYDLIQHFNVPELKELMFSLGLPYDNFTGGRAEMAMQLVDYCKRVGKINKLIELAENARPNIDIDWRQQSAD